MEFTHDSIQRNKLSKNVQFGSVTEILMVGFFYEILIACNVNQQDIHNSIADYMKHEIHINISCHSISPMIVQIMGDVQINILQKPVASYLKHTF